jgi:hypothetical protein
MVDKINIYGVEYPVKFGKGAIQKYCNSFDPPMESLEQFIDHLRKMDYTNLSFKFIDDFAYLLQCGIEMGLFFTGEKIEVKKEILSEWLLQDATNLPIIMKLVTNSLPRGDAGDKKKESEKGEMKE